MTQNRRNCSWPQIEPDPRIRDSLKFLKRIYSEFQKVTTSPESNWLGMQLTPGRWLARLYQSKSFDSSAGQAGQFRVSSKI
jgi:hypothetical protein